MSIGRIMWRPVDVGGGSLSAGMKRALADEYEDGDTDAVAYGVRFLGKDDVPWLERIRDGVGPDGDGGLRRDAAALVEAIGKHGEIKICNEVAD